MLPSPPGDINATIRMFDYEIVKAQSGEATDISSLVVTVVQRAKGAAPDAWQAHARKVLSQVKLRLHAAEVPEPMLPNKLADPMNRVKVAFLRKATMQLEAAIDGGTAP